MRFGADRAAKADARCVLDVADESLTPILAPKLSRIGGRVGLCEAHSTNPSSSMVDGVLVDGLMPRGRPRAQ